MANIGGGGRHHTWEAQSRNIIKIHTKYGFDTLIISGSYGGRRRHTTHDTQRMRMMDDGQHMA